MLQSGVTTKNCPLCGADFGFPTFKCLRCNNYLNVKSILKFGEGPPICPDCNSLLEPISLEELFEMDFSMKKCPECGYTMDDFTLKILEKSKDSIEQGLRETVLNPTTVLPVKKKKRRIFRDFFDRYNKIRKLAEHRRKTKMNFLLKTEVEDEYDHLEFDVLLDGLEDWENKDTTLFEKKEKEKSKGKPKEHKK